jgi:hypothetical protein
MTGSRLMNRLPPEYPAYRNFSWRTFYARAAICTRNANGCCRFTVANARSDELPALASVGRFLAGFDLQPTC